MKKGKKRACALFPPASRPTKIILWQLTTWPDCISSYARLCLRYPCRCPYPNDAKLLFCSGSIRTLFQKAESSAFLKGADGKWNADFNWITDLRNAPRVLEGKYDTLWSKKQSVGGYMPTSELEPTYNLREYIDDSMQRLLNGIN